MQAPGIKGRAAILIYKYSQLLGAARVGSRKSSVEQREASHYGHLTPNMEVTDLCPAEWKILPRLG